MEERTIRISIWKYARRLIGDPPTVVLGNRHCLRRETGELCFGVWAPGGEFAKLVHTATLATMDPRYEDLRPDLTAMLNVTSTFPVGEGLLFAFPGWRAVDATGRIWKGQ